MRHNKKGRKLGTDASHTKAMKRSLVGALLANDRIKTVESRAKEIRPDVDRIITWAKRGDLHARRQAIAYLGDKYLVREIFEKVNQGMFAGREGGYTRIMKLGPRKGDNAPMVIMELVNEGVRKSKAQSATKVEEKKTKSAAPKKTTEAAVDAVESDESAEGVEALGAESAEDIEDAIEPKEVEAEEREEAHEAEEAREAAMEAEEAEAKNAEAAAAQIEEKEKPE